MLRTAVDELATGDVVSNFLGLPELPGQRPLPSCHHSEGKCFHILSLGWVISGQVLGHGVPLAQSSCEMLKLLEEYGLQGDRKLAVNGNINVFATCKQ